MHLRRKHARLQLRMARVHGNYSGNVVLQIPAGLGFRIPLERQSTGKHAINGQRLYNGAIHYYNQMSLI